jgi:hypothetical protein
MGKDLLSSALEVINFDNIRQAEIEALTSSMTEPQKNTLLMLMLVDAVRQSAQELSEIRNSIPLR